MGQKTSVAYVDDIDGSEATHNAVQFALDGVTYEIDLSEKNLKRLYENLAEFVAGARRTGGRRRAATTSVNGHRPAAAHDAGVVRAWLRENGHTIADRGRIPAEMVEEYKAAQGAQEQPVKTKAKAATRGGARKKPPVKPAAFSA